jgi:hypothetical protein
MTKKPESRQQLIQILSNLEEYESYCALPDIEKVGMRIEYELTNYKSGLVNFFFKNIAVIYPRLPLNQMEKLRSSLGTIRKDFFECTDFISLLNAAVSPLFNTKKYKRTVKEAHDEAVKAQAAAKIEATDEAKAFAECMAAKVDVVSSTAAKANFLKSVADKATNEAKAFAECIAAAETNATDQATASAKKALAFAKSMTEAARHANHNARVVKTSTDKKYKGTGQIMLFSGEFDGKLFLKKSFDATIVVNRYKVCIDKYDPTHLKLAEAILEVAIFILQDLLPPVSVNDEERYKLHLRDIGICDEKSVEKLTYERDIDELCHLSSKIKAFFRNGMLNKLSVPPKPKAFHQDVFNSLKENDSFRRFLWETCDTCQKRVDHLRLLRIEVKCTECGGPCVLLPEPTPAPRPTSSAQASDPRQALATELIDAKISFGEPAQKLANVLLINGVCQLSDILVLTQREFESLVQELELNILQVQKLRVASGRQ